MTEKLPDGHYPFVDERFQLADMVMVEAPPELEKLLKAQAKANGAEIIRDHPVELTCRSEELPDVTFLIWYPSGQDRIHLLVPRNKVKGQA